MKTLFTSALMLGLLLAAGKTQAQECSNFSGNYEFSDEQFQISFYQKKCEQVTIADEFGSETLVIDDTQHSIEDYNGSIYNYKNSWSADKKDIVIVKSIVVGDERIFSSTETYSILPDRSVQYKSVDGFGTSSPQTLIYIYQRR